MLTSMYYLKDIFGQLTRKIDVLRNAINPDKKIKKNYVFKDFFNKNIVPRYLDLRLISKEFDNFITKEPDLVQLESILLFQDDKFKDIKDEKACIDFFDPILGCIKTFEETKGWDYHSTYDMGYNTSRHIQWLDKKDIPTVARMIRPPKNRPMRILDPDCRAGTALKQFAEAIKGRHPDCQIEAYAVDTMGWVFGPEREFFKRTILGGLAGSTISHDVFDIVFMPAVDITWNYAYANLTITKAERDVLKKVTEYLAPGGILIFSLPQGHLYREMCVHLAKYYESVNVFRNDADDGHQAMLIIAHKRYEDVGTIDQQVYAALRNMPRHWNTIQLVSLLPGSNIEYVDKLELPVDEPDMRGFKFRGSKLDERDFDRMFQLSPSTLAFNKKQGMNRQKELDKHPATPFSIGQLGLIVTSGVANGLIDEGNGCYHAAKSNVIKHTESEDDLSDDGRYREITETVSNRVEFNVFLADGTAKRLCSA